MCGDEEPTVVARPSGRQIHSSYRLIRVRIWRQRGWGGQRRWIWRLPPLRLPNLVAGRLQTTRFGVVDFFGLLESPASAPRLRRQEEVELARVRAHGRAEPAELAARHRGSPPVAWEMASAGVGRHADRTNGGERRGEGREREFFLCENVAQILEHLNDEDSPCGHVCMLL